MTDIKKQESEAAKPEKERIAKVHNRVTNALAAVGAPVEPAAKSNAR